MEPTKSGDLSKVNLYDVDQGQLGELKQSQEDIIKSLERRYEQPNWFKVSAGFLKPQLGGFSASLGSASEALGENIEKQRESQIPIAQMRAQLAQTNVLLSNKQKAAEIAARVKKENRTYTPAELDEISNLDPQRGQQLIQSQDARAKTIANNRELTINNAKALGRPTPVMNEMGLPETGKFPTGGGNQDNAETPRLMPTPSVPSSPSGDANAMQRAQADVAGLDREIARLQKNSAGYPNGGQDAILALQQEKTNAQNRLVQLQNGSGNLAQPQNHGEGNVLHFMPDTSPTNPNQTQNELQKQQLLEQNKEYAGQFSALNKMIGPSSALGNRTISASNSLTDMLAYDPKDDYVGKDGKKHNYKEEQLNRVIGQLSKGGFINAAMAAAAKGVGVSTSLGAVDVKIPFDTLLKKYVSEDDQAVAEKIATNIAVLKLWQQQHAGQSLGNMPVGEFTLMDAASPSPSSTLSALRYNAAKAHNNVGHMSDLQHQMENIVNGRHGKYKISNEDKPIAYYSAFNSPAVRELRDNYLKGEKEIDQMSEAQARAERRARQSKQ